MGVWPIKQLLSDKPSEFIEIFKGLKLPVFPSKHT